MKSKFDKDKKVSNKSISGDDMDSNNISSKSDIDEDEDLDIDDKPLKKGKASTKKGRVDDEDEDTEEDVEDDWEKVDEDDYDPDFEEFDIPPSKIKSGSVKKGDDDLGLDDDFKKIDLFNDGPEVDDEEDEDF